MRGASLVTECNTHTATNTMVMSWIKSGIAQPELLSEYQLGLWQNTRLALQTRTKLLAKIRIGHFEAMEVLKCYVGVCQSLLKSDTFLQGICTILKLFTWCFLLTNSQTTIWTGNNSTMQKMYLSLGELGFERPCKINSSCDLDWTFHNIEDWSQTWSVTIVLSSLASDWSIQITWPNTGLWLVTDHDNERYSSVPGLGSQTWKNGQTLYILAEREGAGQSQAKY